MRTDSLGGPSSKDCDSVRDLGLETLAAMKQIQALKQQVTGTQPLVWVDTDPGGDDCIALMWLFALAKKGHCRVIGISTTSGNVAAPLTYAGACKLSALCETRVKIGAQTPDRKARFDPSLRRAARIDAAANPSTEGTAAHIHGMDGMGGLSSKLPCSGMPYEEAPESYESLIEALLHYPRQIVLLCIGPLTNLADAEKTQPGILMLARDIVIMGGAFKAHGNITPTSEFNFWHDADAAKKVIEGDGRKSVVIIPLDVTTDLCLTRHLVKRITTISNEHYQMKGSIYPVGPVGQALFLRDLANFLIKSNMAFRCTNGATGFLVHDASTLAFLFYPETVKLKRGHVKINTTEECKGLSYMDHRHNPKRGGSTYVACEVDADAVLSVMVQDLLFDFDKSEHERFIAAK